MASHPTATRLVRVATVLWCRDLLFPTARGVAQAAGLRSPSSVPSSFGQCIDLQAAIIRSEWRRLADVWVPLAAPDRGRWLADHARQLAALDGACLRLPGLVCSAVASSGLVAMPPARCLVPLYALAALAVPGACIDPALGTAAADLWSGHREDELERSA